jgi:hypothetical protein
LQDFDNKVENYNSGLITAISFIYLLMTEYLAMSAFLISLTLSYVKNKKRESAMLKEFSGHEGTVYDRATFSSKMTHKLSVNSNMERYT